jgi:hypothetical protein
VKCEEAARDEYHVAMCGKNLAALEKAIVRNEIPPAAHGQPAQPSRTFPLMMWKMIGKALQTVGRLPKAPGSLLPATPIDMEPFCYLSRPTDTHHHSVDIQHAYLLWQAMRTALGPLALDRQLTVQWIIDAEMTLNANTFNTITAPQWSCLVLAGAMFNHDCQGAANASVAPELDAKGSLFTFKAERDIKAGEEITIPYTTEAAYLARQTHLVQHYGFVCNCAVCKQQETPAEKEKVEALAAFLSSAKQARSLQPK